MMLIRLPDAIAAPLRRCYADTICCRAAATMLCRFCCRQLDAALPRACLLRYTPRRCRLSPLRHASALRDAADITPRRHYFMHILSCAFR